MAPIALAALASCAALPEAPALRPAPLAWTAAAVATADTADERWWLAYGDPILSDLAERAGAADDVVLAEARLREASARHRAARAELAPLLAGSATASRETQDGEDRDLARSTAGLQFDPDLSGATRLRKNAARAGVQAAAARVAGARVAARAEAVRLYVTYRQAKAQAAAAERSTAALADALSIAESRARAGLVSGLDPASARAALARAQARVPAADGAADQARLGLEALLGLPSGALEATLERSAPVPAADLPQVLLTPLAVLARRPDLRAAERDLAAAGFEAAAARRDFWPNLTLEAAFGAQDAQPQSVLLGSGGIASLAAGLIAPLATFGRLEGARDAADARRLEAAIAYRKAATSALREVEQALVAAREAGARRDALRQTVSAARDQAQLAASRYRSGLAPFLEVVAAERALSDAEAELAGAQGDHARAIADLNTALGLGGASPPSAAHDRPD